MKNISYTFIVLFFLMSNCILAGPGNFEWRGNVSTAWSNPSNWSPSGIPGTGDSIVYKSGTYNLTLDSNKTVSLFTITSGTLNISTKTLTITGTAVFSGGTISNGHLVISNSSSATFSGTTFSSVVSVNCSSIFLNGSTFNDSLAITKNGASNDNSKGNNTFNKHVAINNTAGGSIVLADSFPDTFDKTLFVSNINSKGYVYLAHRASGNNFNDNVKFTGRNIYSNYYGTAEYKGNITINCPNGEVYFGSSTGSCTLANSKVLALGDSAFSAGRLTLKNFTKLGTNGDLSLTLTGSASMNFVSSVFNTNVTIVAPGINVQNTRFIKDCSLTKSGNGTQTSIGGNYFGGITSIINNSASSVFTLGSTTVDTFAVGALIKNQAGTLQLSNAIFNDTVRIINLETSTTLDRLFLASTGTCRFKKSIVIQNTGSGLCFGNSNGETQLDSTRTLTFVSGVTGNVTLQHFIQAGSGSLSISFPSDASKLILGPNSTFNANFNYYGKNVRLNGVTFNAAAIITKYGSISDTCSGGNVFNGTTIITDSLATSHKLIMAYASPDDYNSNVTFIQKGTAQFYPAYTKNSTFSGNINVDASSAFQFGGNGGKVILDGTGSQNLSNLSSASVTMKKLQVNKSSNSFTLAFPLAISDSLILTKGWLNTDTTNLLSLANGCKLNGGSDSSFVNGPLKKTGNSAFVFPTGSSALAHPYHPLEITAPSSTSDSYTANYFSHGQTIGTAIDTSIDNLNACQYWKLTRDAGTSTVKVKLTWNHDSCESISPSNYRVTGWDGSKWKDFGNSSFAGDSLTGNVLSSENLSTITDLTFAFKKCMAFRSSVITKAVSCSGNADGSIQILLESGTPPYSYNWAPHASDKSFYSSLDIGMYIITCKDSKSCQLIDTTYVDSSNNITAQLIIEPSECKEATGRIKVRPTGGAGGYKFHWTNISSNDSIVSNLASGIYPVIIQDSLGCTTFINAKIPDQSAVDGVISQTSEILCGGMRTASLEFSPTLGTSPFSYKWERSEGDTFNTINNVGAGKLSLQVIDDNNCKNYFEFEVTQPADLSVNFVITNSLCGLNVGAVEANVTGGERPYFFLWSSLGSDSVEGDLHSGFDTLFVTDNKGCQSSKIAEIFDEDGPVITPHVLSNATCYKTRNGSAWIEVEGAIGEKHYTYWPKNLDNDTIYNLISDDYSVIVEDSLGCRQKADFSITGNEPLDISILKYNSSSDSLPNGKAFAFVEGGSAPYQYSWSNGSTSDSAIGLSTNLYTLTVTDYFGCQDTASLRIRTSLTSLCNQFQCHNTPLPSTCPPITITCPAPCLSITVDVVADFGADNTGSNSSECAFESAAIFLQSLAPDVTKILNIPFGTYIVGRQENIPNQFLYGNSVLCFEGINNLTIQGEIVGGDTTTLIFENCMKMGSFDFPANPEDRLLTCTDLNECAYNGTNYSRVATMGHMIHLSECKNVLIQKLKLEGNIDNTKIGGFWPNGMPYDGIFLNACFNFTIENVIAQNFGHDGIWINHYMCQYPLNSIPAIPNFGSTGGVINSVKCMNNSRNGLTWAGGSGLVVSNSEFSWNGMGRYSLAPGSGMDIEFEVSNFANSNGTFINDVFKYNRNWGVVDDANNYTSMTTYFNHNHNFVNCTFISSGENSVSLRPFTYGMHFTQNCRIIGETNFPMSNYRFLPGINRDGSIFMPQSRSLSFTDSYFLEEYTDPDIPPITTKSFASTPDETICPPYSPNGSHFPIIDYYNGVGINFTNTEVTTNYTMKWIWISGGAAMANQKAWNRFDHVTFNNFGLNACACDESIASFHQCNFVSGCPLNGTNYFYNPPVGGCTDIRNTHAEFNILNPANLWGDNQNAPACVYPTYDVLTIPTPVIKFIPPSIPHQVVLFSDCSGCTGPLDDCNTCSLTQPISYPLCTSPFSPRKKAVSENYPRLSVSPIPAFETLKVKNIVDKVNLEIINMLGNVMMRNITVTGDVEIKIENLPAGTYFLRANGVTYYKFIKL